MKTASFLRKPSNGTGFFLRGKHPTKFHIQEERRKPPRWIKAGLTRPHSLYAADEANFLLSRASAHKPVSNQEAMAYH